MPKKAPKGDKKVDPKKKDKKRTKSDEFGGDDPGW